MMPAGAARDRGRKYVCADCGARKVGPTGLDACPDCGGRVRPIMTGRRKPRPAPVVSDDDRGA